MSLLMDALRKAEDAKQLAAEPAATELTLAPMTARQAHSIRSKWKTRVATAMLAVWPVIAIQRRMIRVRSDRPRLRRGRAPQPGNRLSCDDV